MFFVRTLLAASLAVASVAHADVVHLKCVQTSPTEYRLTYEFTGATRSVSISAGTDANNPATAKLVRQSSANTVTVHAGKPGDRMYFYLKANTGETREVSIRHLELEGTPNFRDLGGYQTTDGRFVRWGLIYRSGVLTYLTPADDTYLAHLGVRVVCDFRTQQENQAAPEKWLPGSSAQMLSLPIGGGATKPGQQPTIPSSLKDMVGSDPTVEKMRARMIATYGDFVFSSADQFAQVFQQIKNDHLPLLYHCTAGKDRTGIFSALLLLTLGVPEKTVLEDYALTNEYLLKHSESAAVQKMGTATGNNMLAGLTKEQRDVLMAADPAYLESTLRKIDQRYGSFDAYRRQALHLSDGDVQELRAKLTQQ